MNDIVATIATSPLTPITLALTSIALIITSFARGWIVSKFTVETLLAVQNLRIQEAIKRGEDYKLAWELSEKRADILQSVVDKLTGVGDTLNRVLDALPAPKVGDKQNETIP